MGIEHLLDGLHPNQEVKMKGMKLGLCLFILVALCLGSCDDDDDGGGICLLDMYGGVQCYDCWSKSTCDDVSSSEWKTSQKSCAEAGFDDYFGNECGYYM